MKRIVRQTEVESLRDSPRNRRSAVSRDVTRIDNLQQVLGDELVRSDELARVALLRRAAEVMPNGDGRPLYAAHAALTWPDSAHSQLWHAVTLLREYRGDGHIAALITNELSGLEALVMHTAAGIGFSVEFARRLRDWSSEQWAAGVDRLRHRGLVDDSAVLTRQGPNCVPGLKISPTSWRTNRGGRCPMTTVTRSQHSRRRSGRGERGCFRAGLSAPGTASTR